MKTRLHYDPGENVYFIIFFDIFSEIGLWHAGVSPRFNFNPNMREKISFHQSKRVIKIVAVVQEPFIYPGIYYKML